MTDPHPLGRLLAALGRSPSERIAICYMALGDLFSAELTTVEQAPGLAAKHADGDCWFSIQPVITTLSSGRGKSDQVVGLRDLYADLDVKVGGLPDFSTAREVIDDLSIILGTPPVGVVMSGHGLQPHWAVAHDDSDPFDEASWKTPDDLRWKNSTSLLRRWGRLVAHVVESRGGHTDGVYDLARVLRTPGTVNIKHRHEPIPTTVEFFDGRAVSITHILDCLNAHAVPEEASDRRTSRATVSVHGDWAFADRTCAYVEAMIGGWERDAPPARHPWFISQTTRLAAAHRAGCIAEQDYVEARELLEARFLTVLQNSTPRRGPQHGEVFNGFARGIENVEAKEDDEVSAELGDHQHLPSDADLYYGQAADFPRPTVSEDGISSDSDDLTHYDVNDLDAIPMPTPLISGVIDADTVAILSGKFGTYKSFMAMAWGASLATGQDWCGHSVPKAVPVIYVAAEGASGVRRRMAAWSRKHGQISRGMFIVVPMRVALAKPESVRKLDALIKKYESGLVILDTLHKMAPGMEETSKDAGEALSIIDQLRQRNAATFLLVHHTGHAGKRSRGSSSIEDDVDTSWVIELGGDGEDRSAANPRILVHRKSKEEELSEPLNLRIVQVEDTGSCYVEASSDPFEAAGGSTPKTRGRPAGSPQMDEFIAIMDGFGPEGCQKDTGVEKAKSCGISQSAAYRLWKVALDTGRMVAAEATSLDSHGVPRSTKGRFCVPEN